MGEWFRRAWDNWQCLETFLMATPGAVERGYGIYKRVARDAARCSSRHRTSLPQKRILLKSKPTTQIPSQTRAVFPGKKTSRVGMNHQILRSHEYPDSQRVLQPCDEAPAKNGFPQRFNHQTLGHRDLEGGCPVTKKVPYIEMLKDHKHGNNSTKFMLFLLGWQEESPSLQNTFIVYNVVMGVGERMHEEYMIHQLYWGLTVILHVFYSHAHS